jgi:hypothetical protein
LNTNYMYIQPYIYVQTYTQIAWPCADYMLSPCSAAAVFGQTSPCSAAADRSHRRAKRVTLHGSWCPIMHGACAVCGPAGERPRQGARQDEDCHKTYLRARQNLMGNYFGLSACRRSRAPKLFGSLEMSFQRCHATAYSMTRPRPCLRTFSTVAPQFKHIYIHIYIYIYILIERRYPRPENREQPRNQQRTSTIVAGRPNLTAM